MQYERLACAFTCFACLAYAQEQPRAFEVATIKPARPAEGINNRSDPVHATWTNTPLTVLIANAYGIEPDQLTGGPAWIASDRWDIVAKTDRPATWAERNKMLQPLLADRFKLTFHWETRQRPEYELTIAKGGPKLHESETRPNASPGRTRIGRGLIDAHAISIAQFTFWLRGELGRPVVDSTGLQGKYDFKVQWTPDESQPNSAGETPPEDAPAPAIFTAIRELGLTLKAIKGPVQVFVVDHAEKPSEN